MVDAADFAKRGERVISGHKPEKAADSSEFVLRPTHMIDPKLIPPRQWIYGTQLIRGFVSLLIAPGGTGKTSYMLLVCMAIATGRPLLSTKIFQRCNTALLNLEDPQDEIDRRIAAIGLYYNISDAEINGRFFMSPADRAVIIAASDSNGFDIVHPDEAAIIERVRDERIGVLGVDPFAESHGLEENSNPQMVQASAAWRRVARLGNCAVMLGHHVRKGPVDSIEAARGAKALTDSARVGMLMSPMTQEESDSLDVNPDERLQYVRVDDAKANLAPRAAKAAWYHLNNVALGNGTETYPNGDQVVVIEAWQAKSVLSRLEIADLNKALDRISDGLPNGGQFSHTRRAPERWAGNVLMEVLDITQGQAAEIIKTWLTNGVLTKDTYHDASQRKDRTGLQVVNSKRPGTVPPDDG